MSHFDNESVVIAATAPMMADFPDHPDVWSRTLTRVIWASLLGVAVCCAYIAYLVT